MTEKLDIFDILARVDDRDITYFDALTDDQWKAVQPFVLMRWMTGCSSDTQRLVLNDVVNTTVFSIPKPLAVKLLMVSSDRKKRYKWRPKAKKASSGKPTSISVLQQHLKCSKAQAAEYLNLYKKEDIIDVCINLGLDKDIVAKVTKEYK